MQFSRIFILLIFSHVSYILFANNNNLVCQGDMETYAVEGFNNSIFVWEIYELHNGEVYDSVLNPIITGQTTKMVDIKWDLPVGQYRIGVTEIIDYGLASCTGDPVYDTIEIHTNNIELDAFYELCENENMQVWTSGDPQKIYEWQGLEFGNIYELNFKKFDTTFAERDITFETELTVRAMDQYGCYGFDTAEVIFKRLPKFDLGDNFSLCGEDTKQYDIDIDGIYTWKIGTEFIINSDNPEITRGEKEVMLTIERAGCSFSDTVNVQYCNLNEYFKYLPNIITPNGDGENEEWIIFPDIEQVFPNVKVEIYNRYGRIVWKSDHYANDFMGRDMSDRPLQMDAYQYILKLGNGHKTKTGSITIVR
ncbi:gliding motility-associated C-terminal domain-containing protein [Bacteroidales bacterium]|nr:gliding motility-associated C-terminal domain-containing protein [Bacteroidales bacterium]